MKIQVKQEHIDNGVREDGSSCAVALAVKEAMPTASDIGVDVGTIDVELGHLAYSVPTPYEVEQFIIDFDNHHPVQPFDFELDLSHSRQDEFYNPDDGVELLSAQLFGGVVVS